MNIHQIAFEQRGKVKKTGAQTIILELARDYPEAIPRLGLLLALHGVPVAKSAGPFAWVAKAVASNKELRKYLRFVMCTGTMMVATDGARLHAAPQTDKAPGLYDPKSGERIFNLFENYPDGEVPADHPGKFPYWERIVPRGRELVDVAGMTLEHAQFDNTPSVNCGAWVPTAQWLAATERCKDVGVDGPWDAVLFKGVDGEIAVIMSYRQQYVEKTLGR